MFNFKSTQSILARSLLVSGLIFYAATPYAQNVSSDTTDIAEQSQAQSQAQWIESNRVSIVQNILNRLAPEAEEAGYEGWREELEVFLTDISAEQLLKAYHAQDYAGVVTAIRGGDPVQPQSYVQSSNLNSNKLLGDTFEDLVFTPLTPCRIIDTRIGGGGKFGVSETRQYSVNGNTSGQGGAVNCGVPGAGGEPPAVVLNITSTKALASGFLKVWQTGAAQPNASILNYTPAADIANASIIPSGLVGANEIQIFARQPTDVIVDVIGFFRKPERTAPDAIVTAENTVNVAANNFSGFLFSPSCPAGYRVSGGGSRWSNSAAGRSVIVSQPDTNLANNRWRCWGHNGTGAANNFHCRAICLSIPGH